MADKLVTIASYGTAEDAHLAKNTLEVEGIPACLADEATQNMMGLLGGFIGGVKLLVSDHHAERACEILSALSDNPAEKPPDERLATTRTCPICRETFDPDLDYCPLCGPPVDLAAEHSAAESWKATLKAEDDAEDPTAAGDSLARKALLSAILGMTFCPGLMTGCAIFLLLSICFGKEELSPRSWTKVYFALGLCAVQLGIIAVYLAILRGL
jgi:hypothetical protein